MPNIKKRNPIKRNVIFNKAGGNAGQSSYSCKLSLPTDIIKELGVSPDDRSVVMTIENGKVILEKAKED